MANEQPPVTRGTLGLTGLTMNAMALIAPGAFLWLTFQMQSLYGAPMAGMAMWFGILFALLLCFATAISYAELSKLYPGPGSSYLYAEQAFLSKTHAYKFARIAKFITGWASHLYYWVYPGVMVGVTAILGGFLLSQFFPDTFSSTYNSPLFMWLFCIVFALGVAYIAFRGVTGTTAVNVVINIVQISALAGLLRDGHRLSRPAPAGIDRLPPVQRHRRELPGRPGAGEGRQGQSAAGAGRRRQADRGQGGQAGLSDAGRHG